MRSLRPVFVCLLAAAIGLSGMTAPAAGQAEADLAPEQVRAAIDRAISYLKRSQQASGNWMSSIGQPGGVTALCTLALLNAGVPPDDPQLKKALTEVRRLKVGSTYVTSLQTMALCAAEPKKDMVLIRRNVKWLEETQIKSGERSGSWSYPGQGGNGDNSNTQFALLALHEADHVGVSVDEQTWRRSYDYWKRAQNADGSWGYLVRHPGTGSMTSAGIASVVIAASRLPEFATDASVVDGSVQCCGSQQNNEMLDRAIAWMSRNFSVERNPGTDPRGMQPWLFYYLYGVERVGRMTNRRFIGDYDWYREGARQLTKPDSQDQLSGFWKGSPPAESNPDVATSLALLFLSKGRRPVLVAKVKHGPGNDWNNHRNDLQNLTTYTERHWERDLTWQVIDPAAAKVEDLLQAPVLFINGSKAPEFTKEQKKNLRDYIDRGGFIFAEACCKGDQFDRGFRALMDDVFPEAEYKLRPLPPSHPVWHAEVPVEPKYRKPVLGIDYGCRTSVVYVPEDVSCYWELGRPGRDTRWPDEVQAQVDAALALGVNVLTYATGRRPKYKDEISLTIESDPEEDRNRRGMIQIAKLLHGGGCNAAPAALVNLLRRASQELKAPVSVSDRQMAISDEGLFQYHLVFMHGRNAFRLTPDERRQLRVYLERGGMLFADSICASPEFSASFRREIQAALPEAVLERIPSDDPIFTSQYGGYDIRRVTRRDPGRNVPGQPLRSNLREVEPDLEGLKLGDRWAVIFSPYDISCALERHESLECNGYTPDDAARIGLNVMLYSLHE